jgi:hypothetical protein
VPEMGYGATVVWPVTMPFELFHYSWEYQRFPYLEVAGPEGIMKAVRSWWASLLESTPSSIESCTAAGTGTPESPWRPSGRPILHLITACNS